MRTSTAFQPISCLAFVALVSLSVPATANPSRSVGSSPARPSAPLTAPDRAVIHESFGRLPLQFEVNRGQVDPRVRYLTRGRGSTLFLTDDEAVWVLSREEKAAAATEPKNRLAPRERDRDRGKRVSSVVRMSLEGSKPKSRLDGLDRLPGNVNYFIGKDPKKWRTDVPTYRKVKVEDVYEGIDLVYYGNQRQLEYDFVVKPGVDPAVIRVAFIGADRISTDAAGDLVVATRAGDLRMKSPLVYQERDGRRELVAAAYVVRPDEKKVEFRIAEYDRTRELVIDPVIVWSTFLGGGITTGGAPYAAGQDNVASIAVGGDGNPIVAGWTNSDDFPSTPGAFQPIAYLYNANSFVTKINQSGTAFIYSTFLGGPTTSDTALAVAADSAGAAYVTGFTSSSFPFTPGAYYHWPGYIYVAKLDPTGSQLRYAALLGGWGLGSQPSGIAVDATGSAYVTGTVTDGDFPTTPGAFQDSSHVQGHAAFVTKLSPDGRDLSYSTILTGEPVPAGVTETVGTDIAVDPSGYAYVTGQTLATSFPVTTGAFQASLNGTSDAFVTKLGLAGDHLEFSSLLGGSGDDSGAGIDVDQASNVFVAGNSSGHTFPTTPGAFASVCPEFACGGFVTKFSADGTALVYSTLLDDIGPDGFIADIVVDSNGSAIVTGKLVGSEFAANPGSPDPANNESFVRKLNLDGSWPLFSWAFGGKATPHPYEPLYTAKSVALAPSGDAYVAGMTRALTFQSTPGVVQPSYGGGVWDSFVVRIHPPLPMSATSISPAAGPSLGGTAITITGTGFQAGAVVRIGGVPAVVTNATTTSISAITGPHPDGLVDAEVENPDGGVAVLADGYTYVCGGTAPTAALSGGGAICAGQSATLSVALTGSGPWNLVWSDGFAQNGIATSPATRDVTPVSTTTYTLRTVTDGACAGAATGSATVTVNPAPDVTLTAPARACAGTPASASIPATTGALYSWTVTNGSIVSGQGTNVLSFIGTTSPVTVSVLATLASCSTTASRDIPVSVPPSATVSGGGTICQGATTDVSFDLTGTPPFTLTWSDGITQPVFAAGPGTRAVSPAATTAYQIASLVDGTGCPGGVSSGAATVNVNPSPSAAITAPSAFCAGAASLAASVPDAGAGATYAWTISGATLGGSSTAPTVTFTPTGASVSLGVTVTLPSGCSASSTHVASLAPAPTAVVSGGGTTCAGSEVVIQASLTGTPPFALTWSDGVVQAGVASTTARRTVRPTAPTTYTVTSLSDANCTGSSSGSAVFSVIEAPSALVTSPGAMICPGGSASIVVQLGGPGPYSLVWSDGLVETVTGPQVVREVSPAATTTYAIDSVSNGTCTVNGLGAARVVVFPDASASRISAPVEVCAESAGHAASVPDSGAGTTYAWTIANGTLVSGQGSRSVAFTAGTAGETALSVTVRVAGGCEVSGSARVRVNARPAVPVITAPASLESGATGVVAEVVGAVGPGFTWTILNGAITSGAGTSRITFAAGDPGVVVLDVVERNPKGCDSPAGHLEIPVQGLSTIRLAPIVLDIAGPGGKRFATELALTNPSPSPVRVDVLYTPATSLGASGPGSASETIGAGQQRVIPDVLAWLREKGLAIPPDGSPQGGTLRVTFDGVAAGWTPSATTRTTVASGAGRAGLSMPALDPDAATASKVWLFGLRENAADRSHVALLNAGVEGTVDLRVTLFSGQGTSVPKHVLPVVRLAAGQWLQLNAVLRQAGFATGYALVERLAGAVPFHAYAVFNDNVTNDGSVVPATPSGKLGGARLVPVVVETGAFTSELILANPAAFPVRARLWFTESLANPGGVSAGGVTVELAAGEQKILPGILAEMRKRGLTIQPPRRDYAGTLSVTFSANGEAAEGWAGARTATTDGSAGRYGLFCPAHTPDPSTGQAWLFGLLQNGSARSNLALVNAAANLGPVTLRYQVFDGVTGKKVATSDPVTLGPGAWMQLNGFLSRWKLENGYVRVERTEGTAPFFAYAVVNDGGVPGMGTGDGSYVEMSTPAH